MTVAYDYEDFDGLGLAELVRRHEVHPLDLVDEAIQRVEALNPVLNAVIHPLYERARQAAQGDLPNGPFRGVPFLVKDLVSTLAGEPMTSGSRFLRGYVPPNDSELVRRYKAAGVVIVGKTNTPEFGIVPFTEPALFGPTRNPWDLERTPGGSSGGSAAAVAARIVPMAGGGDGGGSIRIPSSCCGLFGLKPTRGRNPIGPDIGEAWEGFTVEHVLTRSVRDSAAMLDAVAGPDVGAPYYAPPPERPFLEEVSRDPGRLHIAFTDQPLLGHYVRDDCVAALHATVALLEELGHEVEEAVPDVDGEAIAVAFLTMLAAHVRMDIEKAGRLSGRRLTRTGFEPTTWTLGLLGKAVSASAYVTAVQTMQRAARRVGQFFEGFDLLLTPTLAEPPVPIGALQPTAAELALMKAAGALNAGGLLNALGIIKPIAAKTFDFVPYTPLFNITGQPAMSVPLYWTHSDLPVGLQFVGRFADEATLFRLAAQLEQARPWHDRKPPLTTSTAT